MNNIAAGFHTLPKTHSRSWTYGIVFVALLHIGLVYALITGLAAHFTKYVPHVLEAHIVQSTKPPPKPPPPPEVKLQNPPPIATVPPPDINIHQPAPPSPITVVTAPPKPPAPPAPIAATPVRGVPSTHTRPPYPPLARRLNHEGAVLLQISISPQGRVTDVRVVKSSGHPELDETAANWVKKHWRYRAATRDGRRVASTTQARVRFNLKDARFY